MSINPVQSLGAESGSQPAAGNVRVRRSQPSPPPFAAHSWEPLNSGAAPAPESQQTQKTAAEDEQAQDVVEVQRDSQITSQVVIKYMDQATGRLILQVPSAEVVSVARGISQDLRQAAKTESSSTQASVQGDKHGH